jgi:hypothetical protein
LTPCTSRLAPCYRSVELAVADVAGLLVAKIHKIVDRIGDGRRPDRLKDKDAGDVYRLVRATPVEDMASRLAALRGDVTAGAVTSTAVTAFLDLFRSSRSAGVEMAVRAVQLDVPPQAVQAQFTAYVAALRTALEAS